MKTEFRKAVLPREVRSLMAFDRRIFPKSDCFPADYWLACEPWWMLAGGRRVGCCAFEKGKKSLYISTTGILPKYQGMGFGQLMKAWEISYARYHGYQKIVTNTRKSNAAMIAVNKKFGFRVVRTMPRHYDQPVEPGVLMELVLSR
jgi:ribosomal protein S18 acetylase RimI-like enzyme